MDKGQKQLRELRKKEGEIIVATPAKAARLAGEIVRLKAKVFDKV